MASLQVTAALGALLLAAGAPGAAAAEPGIGRYEALLCVAAGDAAPNCGPAEVDLRAGGAARVRVDDIVYRLEPNGNLIDVVLMHNTVQIDEFTTPYDWQDGALTFADAAKRVRYEVRLGKPLPPR